MDLCNVASLAPSLRRRSSASPHTGMNRTATETIWNHLEPKAKTTTPTPTSDSARGRKKQKRAGKGKARTEHNTRRKQPSLSRVAGLVVGEHRRRLGPLAHPHGLPLERPVLVHLHVKVQWHVALLLLDLAGVLQPSPVSLPRRESGIDTTPQGKREREREKAIQEKCHRGGGGGPLGKKRSVVYCTY